MGVVDEAVSDDVVEHAQVCLFEFVQFFRALSHPLAFLLDYPEEEVVFEGGHEVLDYEPDHVEFVEEAQLELGMGAVLELFLVVVQGFPTRGDQGFAVTQSDDEAEDLDVLGEVDVGEVGLEYDGEGFEFEADMVFDAVFEDADLGVEVVAAAGVVERGR
jgi:hypothetical protein